MPESVILAACGGLITVDKESELVRLVHYTAKEPLKGLLLASVPHPHSLLAAICVTRLADCGYQNTTIQSEDEFNDQWGEVPLLDYAYENWVSHTQNSLDVDRTISLVSAFIAGCRAFPLVFGNIAFGDDFDLLAPLHIVAVYNLPLAYAGPYDAGATNTLSAVEEKTPLSLACEQGHYAAAQSLLDLPGTLVNLAGSSGWTALMYASAGGHEDVVKLLLAHPDIMINLFEGDGWTALILAAASNHESIIQLLLAHPSFDPNLTNELGHTVLMHASKSGFRGAVKALLARPDVKVNMANAHGSTALLLAAEYGQTAVVEDLLAAPDLNVNSVDGHGDTAIKLAAEFGHEDMVRMLLNAPGIVNSTVSNFDGHTAMSAAVANGHHEIVRLLEQFEASRAAVSPGPPNMTPQDIRFIRGPPKERSDSLDSTLSEYFDALDLDAGDDEE